MLMEAKHNILFFFQAVKTSILSAAAYKVNFVIQTVFMMINNSSFLLFWSVVFSVNKGNMKGIVYQDILLLWSIPVISFGVCYFFFGGVENLNTFIISGQLDSFLLQPKNPLINVLTSKCIFSAFGDLLYGLIIGIVATNGNIFKFLIVVFFGTFGSVFYIATEVILRSLSVFLKDTGQIADKYKNSLLTTFSSYPENIFKSGLKLLLYSVIPVAYISYLPIKLVNYFQLKYAISIIIAGFIYLMIAYRVFSLSLKYYESGNSISMKN